MRNINIDSGTPFFCDFYHLTMAQAWFEDGTHNKLKTSEAFFRKCPFNGGYLLSAGLGEFLQWVDNWKVTPKDIEYLAKQEDANGDPLFSKKFLEFFLKQKLEVNVQAVAEGEIVFPNEPVLSVSGPSWQVDMVEAAFLNIFNSQSLIATKASRMVNAACADGVKRLLLEFGLRRSQELGCFSATRAAFIGGCVATSNVAAAQYYDIPVKGTMAHSFVMSYEDETEAFKAFLKSAKGNAILLPDTYETRQGIKNTIRASNETGISLMGARIDSGDLAYWYHEARKLYDDAGMPHVKLVASNDLDEHIIENLIMVQGAKYDTFAAGTKLVTAYDTPALGGVFKTKEYEGAPKIKIAEGKTTIPGATNILRILKDGQYNGDVIFKQGNEFIENGSLKEDITSFNIKSNEGEKVTFDKGTQAYSLLKPVVVYGNVIADDKDYSLQQIQKTATNNLAKLGAEYKRLVNPHTYGVGLEQQLKTIQKDLILAHQTQKQGR